MRRAFTLVELLVVIAIIGILVALLLPAVQAAREAARRTKCKNQLKNIALAMQNHVDTYGVFPTAGASWGEPIECYSSGGKPFGPDKQGLSWAFQILPYIEEGSLHSIGNNTALLSGSVPLYNCPSRRDATAYQAQRLKDGPETDTVTAYLMDYASAQPGTTLNASTGTPSVDAGRDGDNGTRMRSLFWSLSLPGGGTGSRPPDNGVYDGVIVRSPWRMTSPATMSGCGSTASQGVVAARVASPSSFAKITDGSSKTMVIGEKYVDATQYQGSGPSDDRGWLDGWDTDTVRLTATQPYPDSATGAGAPPVLTHSGNVYHESFMFGAAHPGAFQAAFADGSVHSISYDIDIYVFNSLGTRNGAAVGETIDMSGVQ